MELSEILNLVKPLLDAYLGGNGVFLQIVSIVGTLRLLVKPLMESVKLVMDLTPTKKDNEFLEKVEKSKIYQGVLFVLDWLVSFKPKAVLKK